MQRNPEVGVSGNEDCRLPYLNDIKERRSVVHELLAGEAEYEDVSEDREEDQALAQNAPNTWGGQWQHGRIRIRKYCVKNLRASLVELVKHTYVSYSVDGRPPSDLAQFEHIAVELQYITEHREGGSQREGSSEQGHIPYLNYYF